MSKYTIYSPEVIKVQRETGMQPLQALRHVQDREYIRKKGITYRCRSMILQTPVT